MAIHDIGDCKNKGKGVILCQRLQLTDRWRE